MATKKKDPKKPNEPTPFTREGALAILAKHGIPMASQDDPIYNRGPSIRFINRPGRSIKKRAPEDDGREL